MSLDESNDSNKYLSEKENYFPHDLFRLLKVGNNELITESIKPKTIDENNIGHSQINSFSPLGLFEYPNSITGETDSKMKRFFMNKKRKRYEYYNENNEKNKKEKKEREGKKIVKNNNSKKRGPRPKNGNYNKKADHNKSTDDNVMRKIKTHIFKYITYILNKSLKYSIHKFLPLNAKLHEDLKRDFNLDLLNKPIYEIYINEDLNKAHINANNSNKNLIKKIFEEKLEIETIKILNMKFRDIINQIREKDFDMFLNNIRTQVEKKEGEKNKEEIEEEETIDYYMKLIIHYLNDYEEWFFRKNARKTKKKIYQ